MRLPYWLLRLLPMWDYICPRCRRKVSRKTRKCPYCGENYGAPLRVPPRCLKDKKALEDYVHEHIFPKVSASQREYLARFFTEFFSDGFESGDFSAWTSVGGSPTVTSGDAYEGTYKAVFDAAGEYCRKTFTGGRTRNARIYIKFQSFPSSSTNWGAIIELYGQSTTLAHVDIYNDDGDAKWRLWYRHAGVSHTAISTQQTPSLNTWYCVELQVTASTADGQLDGEYHVWVNGNELTDVTQTNCDTDRTSVDNIFCGSRLYSGSSGSFWIDCVVVADTYIGLEGGQTYEVYVDAAVQGFASPVTQTTFNVEKNAAVVGQGLSGRETVFNVVDAAVVSVVSMPLFQSMFNVGSDAVLRVVAEVGVVKEGEVKVTRVFLVLGDLAIQLTGD